MTIEQAFVLGIFFATLMWSMVIEDIRLACTEYLKRVGVKQK